LFALINNVYVLKFKESITSLMHQINCV